MTMPIQNATVYADLQGLDKLRYGADENSPETLGFVAKQFEAIFLQMMLKSAHGESDDDGLFNNQQTEFYQDWHDKQLSIDLASGKGIGIAEMLIKQLQTKQSTVEPSAINTNIPAADAASAFPVVRPSVSPFPLPNAGIPKNDAVEKVSINEENQLGNPQAFVENLWPLAKDAAKKLGVSPEVILAQAALETGWGKKISRNMSGSSSNNLFNIKADSRWTGDQATVSTLEYRDGIAVREQANFRAYDSYAASFSDYVDFMKDSPRYQAALGAGTDAEAFTRELSQAGYATDPNYANKIMKIASGEPLQQALKSIKI